MVRRVRSLSFALVIVLVSSVVWGQQPKRKPEPYVAPLLPAEQAWTANLPAPPSAGAAMDDSQIYIPLEAEAPRSDEDSDTPARAVLIALDRETGARRWSYTVATHIPPVVAHGAILVAADDGIHALGPGDGQRQWTIPTGGRVRAPMFVRGPLLLTLMEGEELIALNVERRDVAWRRAIGESGPVLMTADDQAVFVTTGAGRVVRVNLADGTIPWERSLEGALSEPTVDGNRLFVGSDANRGSLWSLDTATGAPKWAVRGKFLTGPVVGTAVDGDRLLAVSKDNFVRALHRDTGNLRWKEAAGTRPVMSPRVFEGVVAVPGLTPVLSTFLIKDGTAVSTWPGPANALLQGPPLLDTPKPFRVGIVVLLRDGQIFGLVPAAMLFKSPAPAPLTALPGRSLPREEFP